MTYKELADMVQRVNVLSPDQRKELEEALLSASAEFDPYEGPRVPLTDLILQIEPEDSPFARLIAKGGGK